MPQMVEWYSKILLSFGMEMGCLPKAHSLAPQSGFERPRDDYNHHFDEEHLDLAHYDFLVPQRYLHSLQPKTVTSSFQAYTFGDTSSGTKLPRQR